MSWVALLPFRHKHLIPYIQDIETSVAPKQKESELLVLPGRCYMINCSTVVLFIFKVVFQIKDGSQATVSLCEEFSLPLHRCYSCVWKHNPVYILKAALWTLVFWPYSFIVRRLKHCLHLTVQ